MKSQNNSISVSLVNKGRYTHWRREGIIIDNDNIESINLIFSEEPTNKCSINVIEIPIGIEFFVVKFSIHDKKENFLKIMRYGKDGSEKILINIDDMPHIKQKRRGVLFDLIRKQSISKDSMCNIFKSFISHIMEDEDAKNMEILCPPVNSDDYEDEYYEEDREFYFREYLNIPDKKEETTD